MPTASLRARQERAIPTFPGPTQSTKQPTNRCRRRWRIPSLLFFALAVGLLFSLAPVVSASSVPVPTTPNFRFDGQHSDFAQQYYRRFMAGESVPQITKLKGEGVPTEIRAALSPYNLRWSDLTGLLQRALLWEYGFVLADGNNVVRIRTRCGRSMAQIFVGLKAYERIGCSPKVCSMPTGELSYRHKACESWQAASISQCAAEDAIVSSHSDMWGVGADDDLVPDVILQRHTWDDGAQLMYSLHSVTNDVAYNFCPVRPSLIIPCAPYSLQKDKSKWCAPEPGKVVAPWLKNYAAARKPQNSWIIFEIVLVMMFIGSMIYGTFTHLRNKENGHLLELELEELREALLVWRQGARRDKASDALTAEADAVEDLENALDAAACEYFDSSIGLLASAHLHSRDLMYASRRSLSLSLVHEESESGLLESQCSITNSGQESFGVGGTSHRRFDRSISSSSAISLLSGRRSQVALRSFHLFESHSLIRRRRVPFRDIQFNELLSVGNSGEVWRCTLRGQEVAVKQLLPTKRRMLKEMELFMAEVYLLSQLLHPNIVTLVGVAWNTLEHVVMVQEWMQRGDLLGFLKLQREAHGRPRILTVTESLSSENDSEPEDEDFVDHEDFTWQNHKLEIALGVARALAYLHGLTPQLLHRDVKSKNVLLSDAMEVKLCDFGISRRKHHMDEDETNLTVTEAAGTMSWTAPEVLMGDDYGEKVDIYSYGIMLCEVDTCLLPYHDAESMASRLIYHPLRLMKMVTITGLRPSISPNCPPKIASLIHACLDGDPNKRPTADNIVSFLSSDDIV